MKNALRNMLVSSLALIASLGHLPYAFNCAKFFTSKMSLLNILLSILFVFTAVGSNAVLNAHCLLDLKKAFWKLEGKVLFILMGGVGAVSSSCVCFFGLQAWLPFMVTLTISIVVLLVNGAINCVAIKDMQLNLKKADKSSSFGEILFQRLGALAGIIVSGIYYLSAVKGITKIFVWLNVEENMASNLGYILAVCTWLPAAALFSYATQQVGKELYHFFSRFKNKIEQASVGGFLFLVAILASGSAVAQMTLDFYSPDNSMFHFFKSEFVQSWVYGFLFPLAFISTAAVNYRAIKKVWARITG